MNGPIPSTEIASGWYARALQPAEPRAPLAVDLDVDVCVIGGGLAGLTAAYEVARRGWSVAVLDGGRIAGAASGRNTGFVLPGFGEDLDAIVERIGVAHARQLWALSEAGLDYVRSRVATMPEIEPQPGWLYVSKTPRQRHLTEFVGQLRAAGTAAEYWPAARVRAALPSAEYYDAVYYPAAFTINPVQYAHGLARAAEAAGARIFEATPALSIDSSGIRKRIDTPAARVRAAHVVLAGNVDIGGLMPRLAATLIPITTYVMVSAPIGPALRDTLAYRGAVSDGDRADHHYRIVGDDRLMWCGRMTTAPRDPQRFARTLARDVTRAFPQLGSVEPDHVWSGTLGIPIHCMPQIGELMPGVWVASGFGGHGLNTTAMAGDLVARGIVENDQTWRLFAPYELVWAGGAFGRAAMRALYLGRRPVESASQGWARFRERAKARKIANRARRETAPLHSVADDLPDVASVAATESVADPYAVDRPIMANEMLPGPASAASAVLGSADESVAELPRSARKPMRSGTKQTKTASTKPRGDAIKG
jgi:glycine/D-amino acid oxidase-like deaminating enzyme